MKTKLVRTNIIKEILEHINSSEFNKEFLIKKLNELSQVEEKQTVTSHKKQVFDIILSFIKNTDLYELTNDFKSLLESML